MTAGGFEPMQVLSLCFLDHLLAPSGRGGRTESINDRPTESTAMADESENGEDEAGPAVELGEGESVEGAPLGRITARFHFGIERSEILRREGDTVIRTPDGPRELQDVLAESDETYFVKRADLERTLRDIIGHGPVPTADE